MPDTAEHWLALLSDARLGARPRRQIPPKSGGQARNSFQRDFDRIVFSTAFRRLHDKTQVFPLPENDLVHSRLTHSLEVSCVGRSLGTMVGQSICARSPHLSEYGVDARSWGDIVAAACVAHDIGNPPFGHAGEDAIASWFRDHPELSAGLSDRQRADLKNFEGNAQGFRILTRLQIPENPGLQLTMATLAAFTKYPRTAGKRPLDSDVAVKKHGVFDAELGFLEQVTEAVGLKERSPIRAGESQTYLRNWPRHPLAFLMEAADDICYSILDIEDGFRLNHVRFDEVEAHLHEVAKVDQTYQRRSPQTRTEQKETIAYLRAKAINQLAKEVCTSFLKREEALLSGTVTEPLSNTIPSSSALEAITRCTRDTCYDTREVVEAELSGYKVLSELLEAFVPAVLSTTPTRQQRKIMSLLSDPIPPKSSPYERLLRVTDFLSGMTDRYAVATYRRLYGITLGRRA